MRQQKQTLVVFTLHYVRWLGQPSKKRRKCRTQSVWVCLWRIPRQQQSESLASRSPHLSLSSSLTRYILLNPASLSSPAADEENPAPVGQPACQPVCPAEGPANHHLAARMLVCTTLSTASTMIYLQGAKTIQRFEPQHVEYFIQIAGTSKGEKEIKSFL